MKPLGPLVLGVLLVSGCAPALSVKARRPAELDLQGARKVAILGIGGEGGEAFEQLIQASMRTAGFEVLDRSALEVLADAECVGMTGSLGSPEAAAAVGRALGVDLVIAGRAAETYEEKLENSEFKDAKTNATKTLYRRRATARVSVDLGLHLTGRPAAIPVKLVQSAEEKPIGYVENPPPLDREAIMRRARKATAGAFLRKVAAYEVVETVHFLKRRSIPELGQGIELVRGGRLDDAVSAFERAVEGHPSDTACWFDLGVGYELRGLYDDADRAYGNAGDLRPAKIPFFRKPFADLERRHLEDAKRRNARRLADVRELARQQAARDEKSAAPPAMAKTDRLAKSEWTPLLPGGKRGPFAMSSKGVVSYRGKTLTSFDLSGSNQGALVSPISPSGRRVAVAFVSDWSQGASRVHLVDLRSFEVVAAFRESRPMRIESFLSWGPDERNALLFDAGLGRAGRLLVLTPGLDGTRSIALPVPSSGEELQISGAVWINGTIARLRVDVTCTRADPACRKARAPLRAYEVCVDAGSLRSDARKTK